MWYLVGALLVVTLVACVVLVKNMNMLFYSNRLRVYCIARDNGVIGTPYVVRAFMHQTDAPWWRGKGVQFRVKNYTFQVGILREQVVLLPTDDLDDDLNGLLVQLGGRELEVDAKTIRKEWR